MLEPRTCTQPELLADTNTPAITKKWLVVVLTFDGLSLKIHINHFGALA